LGELEPDDPAAPRFNDVPSDNPVRAPVRPFHQDIGLDARNGLERRVLVEHEHRIYEVEREQDLRPFLGAIDWTVGTLVRADRSVGVHSHDQCVAEAARLPQVANVSRMQQVEHAVGKDHSPTPTADSERESDGSFLRLAERLLAPDSLDRGTFTAFATHDPRMVAEVRRLAAERGVPRDRFEFQMLYGIGRDLQAALVASGYAVRIYIPYGDAWFPYFMRRLAERPANVGFVLKSLLKGG